MKKKLIAIVLAIAMIATLLVPMFTVSAVTGANTIVFELGDITYKNGIIEVPLNIVENNSDIYTAEIILESDQGLACSSIVDGTIKNSYGSVGFNYTKNAGLSKIVLDAKSVAVDTTGLVATFKYTAPAGFDTADLADYTFSFGDGTMLIADDFSYPKAILKEKDASTVEPVANTIVFEYGEVTYNSNTGKIEVPLYIVESNSDIYTAQIFLISEQDLACSNIINGTIKDSNGYGFAYTTNPSTNLLLIDSHYGVDATGLLATFCYTAPAGFNKADLANYTFSFGEDTMLVAFDLSRPTAVLKEKEVEVPECEHTETKEVVTKEAAVGVAGSKNIVCSDCGVVLETVSIPALEAPVNPDANTIVFELGEITYDASSNEIEVPLYIVENNNDIYVAEIYLISDQGLACSKIMNGTIKDSNGYGLGYITNPSKSLLFIESSGNDYGVDTTGLVATFCYTAPAGFNKADLADCTFSFGENTMLVAYDDSQPEAILKEKDASTVEPVANTIVFEYGEVTYNSNTGKIEVPLYIVESNSDIYVAEIYLISEQGLACSEIMNGTIKDSNGYGFAYTTNPSINLLLIDSYYGVDATGLLATFCYTAPAGFNKADLADFTFKFGEKTLLVAFDQSRPEAILREKEVVACEHTNTKEVVTKEAAVGVAGSKNIVCADCGVVLETIEIPALQAPVNPDANTIVFELGEITYDASSNEIEVPLNIVENNRDIYTAQIYLISDQGLVCSNIVKGTINGFQYLTNPSNNILVLSSVDSSNGVKDTGFLATFRYTAPADFDEAELADYTFGFGEGTMLVAFDDSRPEAILRECKHLNIEEKVLKEASCTEVGYKEIVCTDCAKVIDTLEIPAANHSETKEVIVKKAELGVAGSKNIVCVACDEVIETVEIPAINTVFELGEIIYNAEYGEIEVPLYITENNSDIYTAEIYLESEQDLECTYIEKGDIKDSYTDSRSGKEIEYGFDYTINESISMILIDSEYTNAGIDTTGCVATFYFKVPTDFDESAIGEYTFRLGKDTMLVSFDASRLVTVLLCNHSSAKSEVLIDATCTEDGLLKKVCNRCNEVIEEVIPATGHTFIADPENDIAPTCTESGRKAYKCHCGEVEMREGEVALGHRYDGDCDAVCNVCDGERETTADHTYSLNGGHTCSVCKYSKTPDAPLVLSKTQTSIALVETEGFEYSIDGINWQDSGLFEGLEAETEYVFYQRVAESDISDVSYTSDVLNVSTEPLYAPGDVNGDYAVDAADLRLLKLLIAKLIPIDAPEVKNTEVDDESGVPTASDLRVLKLIIAKLL